MLNSLKLCLALFLLNSALTFQNRWPTLGVRWTPELSFELAILVLGLALATAWRRAPGRRMRNVLLGIYLILVLGRYLDVTVPALMGRPVHLYWDSQHLPHLLALFLDRVTGWQVLFSALALLLLLAMLMAALGWALTTLITALNRTNTRRWLGTLAVALLVLFGAGRLSARLPTEHWFALPVTGMAAEQIRLVLAATVFKNYGWIAAQPQLPASNLGRLDQGDLFLIFFESYGALVFDDPRFAVPLTDDFAAFEQALTQSDWRVASARLESSTFGGGSWLAHSSVLSGLRIADQGDYQYLLTTDRSTLVSRFAAVGYRCIAVMPGLKYAWPEGQFYRFADLYDPSRLNYRGPAYGWWVIPDQYSLYRVHQLEVAPAPRAPLFVFSPTINSHAPFAPLPPYEADWSHFDAALAATAMETVELNQRLDGQELAAAYVQSIRYNLKVLGGYLRQYAPPQALFVVLGDHQPPAAVGGRDSSWQVPVHVFSRDPALIAAFEAAGFQPGIKPGAAALGGIEKLGPLLLQILDRP